eukprot:6418295-Lingulodinium_polyedra.AAC.1
MAAIGWLASLNVWACSTFWPSLQGAFAQQLVIWRDTQNNASQIDYICVPNGWTAEFWMKR